MVENPNDFLAEIRQKPIALFGLGTSGRGVRALAGKMGMETTVFDEAEVEGARTLFSKGDAHLHSAVVLSPGFPLTHPWVTLARECGLEILSELRYQAQELQILQCLKMK